MRGQTFVISMVTLFVVAAVAVVLVGCAVPTPREAFISSTPSSIVRPARTPTAACHDDSLSFSASRQGTCPQHRGVRESRRRVTGLLLAGWLLGLLTAFVWPAVTTERQTVVVTESGGSMNTFRRVAFLANSGWIVSRTDSLESTSIVQLERARYISVYEDLRDRPRGSWCWLRTGDWYC
jgi:hypothetical protein